MKKTYCILCLICMFAATSVGISFAENEASKSQVTEEQFQALLRKAQAGDPNAQALVRLDLRLEPFLKGPGTVPPSPVTLMLHFQQMKFQQT